MMQKKQLLFPLICCVVLTIFYTIWSYTQTDPNLVLTSWSPYWNWQQGMWQVKPTIFTVVYLILIAGMSVVYFWWMRNFISSKPPATGKKLTLVWLSIVGILMISYNALSHDVFNYIFNARMVVKYGADPHVRTALEFAGDDWVRFMHNVHTPAPYFYGWTGLSLMPYLAGFSKFTLTWLLFRLWSFLGLGLLILAQFKLIENLKLEDKAKLWIWMFALNPLVVIEIVSNSHNDAWMMAGAIGSLAVLIHLKQVKKFDRKIGILLLSLVLLLASISIKYVTILLLPIWLYIVWTNWQSISIWKKLHQFTQQVLPRQINWRKTVDTYLFDLACLLMFLPLLTARSQQFHPWYLVWSLSFLPFLKINWWRNILVILSISSLFRYVPWLWNGGFEFTDQIQIQQKLITWIPLIVYIVVTFSLKFVKNKKAML